MMLPEKTKIMQHSTTVGVWNRGRYFPAIGAITAKRINGMVVINPADPELSPREA
jgi:hypothetical protein